MEAPESAADETPKNKLRQHVREEWIDDRVRCSSLRSEAQRNNRAFGNLSQRNPIQASDSTPTVASTKHTPGSPSQKEKTADTSPTKSPSPRSSPDKRTPMETPSRQKGEPTRKRT